MQLKEEINNVTQQHYKFLSNSLRSSPNSSPRGSIRSGSKKENNFKALPVLENFYENETPLAKSGLTADRNEIEDQKKVQKKSEKSHKVQDSDKHKQSQLTASTNLNQSKSNQLENNMVRNASKFLKYTKKLLVPRKKSLDSAELYLTCRSTAVDYIDAPEKFQ